MPTPATAWLRALLAATVALALGCADGGSQPPNLLLISVDTLRRDALHVYDADAARHPALDRLAREGVVFEHALSPASWTLPAHASLFTGLYPDRHGAITRSTALGPLTRTLAGELGQLGYESVGFTDGGYMSRRFGLHAGFDRYDRWTRQGRTPGSKAPAPKISIREETEGSLFARSNRFLKQRGRGSPPFFLFVHTFAVHNYFKARPWAVRRVGPADDLSESDVHRCQLGRRECTSEQWARLRALYAAEIARLDEGLARLLATLDETGLSASTLVILLSDHGEGFDPERGRTSHGGRLHEDLIRLPLIVHGPGLPPGRVALPVSLVDVLPTVLDLVAPEGFEPPTGDGRSFARALVDASARAGAAEPGRSLYAMAHGFAWENGRRVRRMKAKQKPHSIALIDGAHWYIRAREEESLYDLGRDPEQRRNLAPPAAPMAPSSPLVALRREAAARLEAAGASGDRAPVTLERDEALEAELRALGYVE